MSVRRPLSRLLTQMERILEINAQARDPGAPASPYADTSWWIIFVDKDRSYAYLIHFITSGSVGLLPYIRTPTR
jgi:hypothetical protein